MANLPNKIKCKRCGWERQTNDLASIGTLVKNLPEITNLSGLTFTFAFCDHCRQPNDTDLVPEVELTQTTEYPII